MRIVFMGSPEFALPSLRALIAAGHEIVGVYTQPDRPAGRGRAMVPPPVKALALEHGLRVFQPKRISRPEHVEALRALGPDVGVIAAYGQILKQPVLDVPPLGILNVHASLLPRWRGAAPITAAILAGDAESGATIMKVELALDAGPMLAATRVPIAADDTTGTLTSRIAEAGAALLVDVLPRWAAGNIDARPQDDALATYAPQIEKSDGLIHWERDSAAQIERQVRAYQPWPVAYTLLDGQPLRVLEASVIGAVGGAPGTIAVDSGALVIAAAEGALVIERLQPPGGKPMRARDYLNGHREIIGKRLTA